MKIREEFTCPLELVQDMIKGKWKPIIIWLLRKGSYSLAALEKEIDGINQKMLLEQLKELQEYGFVDKKTYSGYPLRVEYFLTENHGRRLLQALEVMQKIGIEYMIEHGRKCVLVENGIISEDYEIEN
ncbi:MAG: helix-turn-helix domain-containing protein [Candidatus Mucispirillum faecigallinarum]|nr:helix-turn-helix domain-containing protein [Candidatus Mucispirillum faecigallinarum]